ncbi:hypothetical protein NDU88_011777, partial [Pleurodeles waltl]
HRRAHIAGGSSRILHVRACRSVPLLGGGSRGAEERGQPGKETLLEGETEHPRDNKLQSETPRKERDLAQRESTDRVRHPLVKRLLLPAESDTTL